MDERLQFVARRLAGEPMAELCREVGISRKTGYKIFDRYQDCGVEGLTDRSRRPYRYANKLPFQVENFILNVKREHSSWGARKIRERLIRRFSGIQIPAKSTIHAVLDRHGLVERRGRLRRRAQGTALSLGQRPHELWCTDYKGEFLLGNRQYCYPLTVTDHASRYLLTCEALSSTEEDYAFTVFERLFKERGLPSNMRSDNGVPFASAHAHALFHLSKLAVWWLRLGIGIERIKPGHPQQNGRHERMHLTLKKETTKPAGLNFLQQQARFWRRRAEADKALGSPVQWIMNSDATGTHLGETFCDSRPVVIRISAAPPGELFETVVAHALGHAILCALGVHTIARLTAEGLAADKSGLITAFQAVVASCFINPLADAEARKRGFDPSLLTDSFLNKAVTHNADEVRQSLAYFGEMWSPYAATGIYCAELRPHKVQIKVVENHFSFEPSIGLNLKKYRHTLGLRRCKDPGSCFQLTRKLRDESHLQSLMQIQNPTTGSFE